MANTMYTSVIPTGLSVAELPRKITKGIQSNTTIRTFKGIKADVISLSQTLEAQGYQCELNDGPLWTLTATIGTLLTDVDTNTTHTPGAAVNANDIINWEKEPKGSWSIGYKEENKDILENVYCPLVSGITDKKIMDALKDWAKNGPKDSHPAYKFSYEDTTNETANYQRAEKLYQLMSEGVKTIPVQVLTVRNQLLVPKKKATLVDYFNHNGNIIRVESMYQEPTMEPWVYNILFELAEQETFGYEDLEQEGSAINGASTAPVVVGKKFGFLKKVNMEPSSDQRMVITIEYTFGLWATDIYGLPS